MASEARPLSRRIFPTPSAIFKARVSVVSWLGTRLRSEHDAGERLAEAYGFRTYLASTAG